MKYVVNGTVSSIEERWTKRHIGGIGDKAVFIDVSTGWFVSLEEWKNSSIFLGGEKPDLSAGDKVRVSIERL